MKKYTLCTNTSKYLLWTGQCCLLGLMGLDCNCCVNYTSYTRETCKGIFSFYDLVT